MKRRILFSLSAVLFFLKPASALDCFLFNTLHCATDCNSIPVDIKCDNVPTAELSSLLQSYANISVAPLRLTIKRSPHLQNTASLFAPVGHLLWDLRIETDSLVNEIPRGYFSGLDNLKYLDLSGNKLAHLHAADFFGLDKLRGIKLERNPLINLASGVFEKLSDLKCLDLDDNALTCDCKMLWMKQWAREHPLLWDDDQELYIGKTKDSVEDLEDCDGDMPDCEYPPLLHDRNITDIPDNVCETFLSDADCSALQSTHCRVFCDNWTPMQIMCSSVEYNELRSVLTKYSELSDRVLRLDITKSSNLIMNTSLWEPVKDHLIHLSVSHSKLTLAPSGPFSNLHKLVYLQLEDDEITAISANAFSGLTALKGLSLDDTSTEVIDASSFMAMGSLKCLKLDDDDDNLCDCDMQWLQGWSRNHTELFAEKTLMYDFGVKVFCEGDEADCEGKNKSKEECS